MSYVVLQTYSIAGTVADFNASAFRFALARVVNVQPADVTIANVTAGSVVVDVEIEARTTDTMAAVSTSLTNLASSGAAAAGSALGFTLESISMPTHVSVVETLVASPASALPAPDTPPSPLLWSKAPTPPLNPPLGASPIGANQALRSLITAITSTAGIAVIASAVGLVMLCGLVIFVRRLRKARRRRCEELYSAERLQPNASEQPYGKACRSFNGVAPGEQRGSDKRGAMSAHRLADGNAPRPAFSTPSTIKGTESEGRLKLPAQGYGESTLVWPPPSEDEHKERAASRAESCLANRPLALPTTTIDHARFEDDESDDEIDRAIAEARALQTTTIGHARVEDDVSDDEIDREIAEARECLRSNSHLSNTASAAPAATAAAAFPAPIVPCQTPAAMLEWAATSPVFQQASKVPAKTALGTNASVDGDDLIGMSPLELAELTEMKRAAVLRAAVLPPTSARPFPSPSNWVARLPRLASSSIPAPNTSLAPIALPTIGGDVPIGLSAEELQVLADLRRRHADAEPVCTRVRGSGGSRAPQLVGVVASRPTWPAWQSRNTSSAAVASRPTWPTPQ